ncbi:MAG TPA: FecR domain-containing protein [Bacteroidales bacterium]|nr:FecR domain-containing protein [Bacteroidales bacterium]
METNPTYYNDLINKYFSGNATEKEAEELAEWINAEENNRKIFDLENKLFQLLNKSAIEKSVNLDEEWMKLKTAISGSGNEVQETFMLKPEKTSPKIWVIRVLQVAAVFVILLIAGYFLYPYLAKVENKVLIASSEVTKASLPDGTYVTLRPGSTIEYPSKFKEDKRKIKLDGEAYFEVRHNESQPFLIAAGTISVEVLGTSFFVNTNAPGNTVEVKVTTGTVAVYYTDKAENKIILKAGENASLSKNENELPTTEILMPSVSEKIEFMDQPLSKIVFRLNMIYNADIRLASENIGKCRMTAAFENQSLDAVLNVISSTLDLQISRKGNTFILSGECSH